MKFFIWFLLFFPSFILAQNAKMKELAEQKAKAIQEIQTNDLLLKETKINTASLMNRLQLVESQIQIRKGLLEVVSQEMVQLKENQKEINSNISSLSKELEEQKKNYDQAIQAIMRNQYSPTYNKFIFLLSGKNLGEMFRRFIYLKDYSYWIKAQMDDIDQKNTALNKEQIILEESIKKQQLLMAQYDLENNQLKKEEEDFKKQVAEAKSKETEINKIILQKKSLAKKIDAQIEKLVAQEIDKQANLIKKQKQLASQKTQSTEDKSPESNNKTEETNADSKNLFGSNEKIMSAIEQGNIKLSSNFANNKGKLPSPITGKYSIVGHFGTKKESVWVTTNRGGIDIQSQAHAQARAVFSGQVSQIFTIPGYGTCILLRHGDYFTFYGNIVDIHVKKDDNVETGQVLGSVFTEPNTNIAEMHFQIWKLKQKLNPELWLRR